MQSVPSIFPVLPSVAEGPPDMTPSEEGAFLASFEELGPAVQLGREGATEVAFGEGKLAIHLVMQLPYEPDAGRRLTDAAADAAVLEVTARHDLSGDGDPVASHATGRPEAPENELVAGDLPVPIAVPAPGPGTSGGDQGRAEVDRIVGSVLIGDVRADQRGNGRRPEGANAVEKVAGDRQDRAGSGKAEGDPAAPYGAIVSGRAGLDKAGREDLTEPEAAQSRPGTVGRMLSDALRADGPGLRDLAPGTEPSAAMQRTVIGWPTPQAHPRLASEAPHGFAPIPQGTPPAHLWMATGPVEPGRSTAHLSATSPAADGEKASPAQDGTLLPRAGAAPTNAGVWEWLFSGMAVPAFPANDPSEHEGKAPPTAAGEPGQTPDLEGAHTLPALIAGTAGASSASVGPDQDAVPNAAADSAGPATNSETGLQEVLSEVPALAGPLAQGMPSPLAGQIASGPLAPSITQVAAQLSAALQTTTDGGTELALSPEELGRVRLRLEPDRLNPDRVFVLMTFERPETLDLFRRHAADLSEALRAAGYAGADLGFDQEGSSAFGSDRQSSPSDHTEPPEAVNAASPAPRLAAGASLDLRL